MKNRFSKKVQGLYYHYRRSLINYLTDKAARLVFKPIYFSYFSRDCDMYETSYTGAWRNGRKKYEEMKMEAYEGAEGPMSFTEISYEDYEQEKGPVCHRDRTMEAYENGNGNSIYV
jgi:hypothetical protein